MTYRSLDAEWDNDWAEMGKYKPEVGDKVLCCCPEVRSGTVVEERVRIEDEEERTFYLIEDDEDGSFDEHYLDDVMVRKPTEVAA
jgi:hypothetical protein